MNAAIASLIDELERDSRERSRSLEALGRLPYGFTAEHHPRSERELREGRRLQAALMMTDDVDVFCALARGEVVRRHRIRQDVVIEHRLRGQDGRAD